MEGKGFTNPLQLVTAHEERCCTLVRRSLDFDVIMRFLADPTSLVEISSLDEPRSKHTLLIGVDNIRSLSAAPAWHISIVGVHLCVPPDCALPVIVTEAL